MILGPASSGKFRLARPSTCIGARFAVGLIVLVVAAGSVRAGEPAEEFLAALQQRGLHELALDYLERMETSALASADFRRQIPIQRGVVQLELARRAVDPDARERALIAARQELERYAAANPTSAQAAEAQTELAGVLAEQGKHRAARAAALPDGAAFAAEREKLRTQARAALSDARGLFQQVETIYRAELDSLEGQRRDAADNGEPPASVQELRGRVAQAQVLAGQLQYELAQTYAPDSLDFRRAHEAAAAELAALHEQHSRWLIGLYAKLYEGRSHQALGDFQQAHKCFAEVQSQPSILPAFRSLITTAYRYRAECYLAERDYDQAIESCRGWLRGARPEEKGQPEWLAVRYWLAEATRRKAESLAANSPERRRLAVESRDLYRTVAATAGEFQSAARSAAAALDKGGGSLGEDPDSFAAAVERGREALSTAHAAKLALPTARRNNSSSVGEFEAQIQQGMEVARRNFLLATTLVDAETDLAQLNEVRYFLSWLYWEGEDYFRAAVLGEFVARRYPNHALAAAAAKLAMASFERLDHEAIAAGSAADDKEFAARQMAAMAEFITRRWPESDDAGAAFGVLVSYAIRSDRIEDAERLLAEVAPEYRPRLELQLGTAMWHRYLTLLQPGSAGGGDADALAELKAAAVGYLRRGLDAAGSQSPPSPAVAAGGLYLVQALLSDGEYAAAIELLEDERSGPLALVSRGDAAAARPEFAIEVYKAAVRAFVSTTPPREQRVIEIMRSLEGTVASAGGLDGDQLARIYMAVGVALQQQIAELRGEGREADAARLAATFAEFLSRADQQQEGASWASRAWLAQTNYALGTSAATGSTDSAGAASAAKAKYLDKARDAFEQMLAAVDADPSFAPSEAAVLAVRKNLADCYRELGQYKQALDTYSTVLRERENSLSVQQAAAQAYQAWGVAEDPRWLERAIYGGYRLRATGQNRIWGWIKLAQVAERAARSNPAFWDTFFDARLNAARCRYLAAMESSGPERQQNLARARQSIRSMVALYPDLGGDRWRREFDALMREIQTAAGQQPVGLREFTEERP